MPQRPEELLLDVLNRLPGISRGGDPAQHRHAQRGRREGLPRVFDLARRVFTPPDVALLLQQDKVIEGVFSAMPKRAPISRAVGTNRKEDRIRSHVLLCWLALHLVRVAEWETGETWDRIWEIMDRIHLGEFFGKDGKVLQRTELTQDHTNLLKKLKISPQPLFRKIAATTENP